MEFIVPVCRSNPAQVTRRQTEREAERTLTRLLNQVDERRSPRTGATVNELLDRWFDVIDVEHKTKVNYISKIYKHRIAVTVLGGIPSGTAGWTPPE